MQRNYDLLITNCITNDIEIVPKFSDFVFGEDEKSSCDVLYFYTKKYIVNQIPFKVEFRYKNTLGK